METTQQNEELEIDVLQLFYVLRSHIVVILLSGLFFAMVGLLCTKLLITPQYVSTAKLYVLNRSQDTSTSTVTSSDLQSSSYLTADYIELCGTREVMEKTVAKLGLDITADELSEKVSIAEVDDTRVIEISVTDPDPYVAAQIAETLTEVASDHIKDIMEVDAVHTADKANIPTSPVSPSVKKNTLFAALAGIVLAIVIVIVTFLLNDTLKTSEDVEKYLGLYVLGVIPLTEDEKESRKRSRKRTKRSKTGKRG